MGTAGTRIARSNLVSLSTQRTHVDVRIAIKLPEDKQQSDRGVDDQLIGIEQEPCQPRRLLKRLCDQCSRSADPRRSTAPRAAPFHHSVTPSPATIAASTWPRQGSRRGEQVRFRVAFDLIRRLPDRLQPSLAEKRAVPESSERHVEHAPDQHGNPVDLCGEPHLCLRARRTHDTPSKGKPRRSMERQRAATLDLLLRACPPSRYGATIATP